MVGKKPRKPGDDSPHETGEPDSPVRGGSGDLSDRINRSLDPIAGTATEKADSPV